jgi:hypothetical protein
MAILSRHCDEHRHVAVFCLASKGSKAKPDESDDAAFINSELGEEIFVAALARDGNGNGWEKSVM